jgi:K+-transporting ATPase KdpF subunit
LGWKENRTEQLYEGPDFGWNCFSVLCRQRPLRSLLRETLGSTMETIIIGAIALLLFAYLFVAMIRPEKF